MAKALVDVTIKAPARLWCQCAGGTVTDPDEIRPVWSSQVRTVRWRESVAYMRPTASRGFSRSARKVLSGLVKRIADGGESGYPSGPNILPPRRTHWRLRPEAAREGDFDVRFDGQRALVTGATGGSAAPSADPARTGATVAISGTRRE